MKKLIDKIRKWLICRLGGVTLELHNDLIDREILRNIKLADELGKLKTERDKLKTERDILRDGDTTHKALLNGEIQLLNAEIKNYRIAVREICRRSDQSYYNWCCSECHTAAENPLFCSGKGWCRGFTPIPRPREEDV